MPFEIVYICKDCGEEPSEEHRGMICEYCKGHIRGNSAGITGTRDNFGIKNAFTDEDGSTVDNWKDWEKKGFRQPKDVHKEHHVKEKIKMKMEKINKGLS